MHIKEVAIKPLSLTRAEIYSLLQNFQFCSKIMPRGLEETSFTGIQSLEDTQ